MDLIVPPDDPALTQRIQSLLPEGAQVMPVAARTGAVAQMTAAFRTNLTALSLLALVVGMFLIYNSMTFSVVQRRPLFGTLRCLGVTRGEIGLMVLGEAAIIGLIGAVLGIALGLLLGQGAVRLVTQTINDLYYVVTVRGVAISGSSIAKGLLLGIGATLASAALPAWEAAGVPARQALSRSGLEDRTRRAIPFVSGVGAFAAVIGGVLLALPTRNLVLSFAGIFFITIGLALLTPIATLALLRIFTPITGGALGILGRMAPRSLSGALSRTVVAIAALSLAVSVTIGVGLMVDSFRGTVVAWLGQTLWGDVYITAPSLTATRNTSILDGRVYEIAREWPGVERADVLRSVDVDAPDGPIAVSAVSDEDFTAPRIFVSTDGPREAVMQAARAGAVLASEPLANRLGLPAKGATVTLYTDHGAEEFPVAGIYRDYSSSQGTILMALDLYREHWNDPAISAVALKLAPDADADDVVRDLGAALTDVQGVMVRPNAALRADALAVFDRAFAITGALQLLAALVAFVGILERAARLAARTGARVRRDARHRAHRTPVARPDVAGDGHDGRDCGHPGAAHRVDPGAHPDLRHQPAFVRLDAAIPAAARSLPASAGAGRGRGGAGGDLPGDTAGADAGGGRVARRLAMRKAFYVVLLLALFAGVGFALARRPAPPLSASLVAQAAPADDAGFTARNRLRR